MRGAQTIRRSSAWLSRFALAALAAAPAFAVGCDEHPRAKRVPPPRSTSSSGTPAAEATPDPVPSLLPPIAQAIEEVREQKLEILPPRDGASRLGFGKGRLAQAAGDKVVFRSTNGGAVIAEATLGDVRAIATGVDGSLIALGATEGVRLEPSSTKPRSFPHVAFFRGAALFADLEQPSHIYVYYEDEQQLFHYALEAEAGPFLPIEDRFPLLGCVGSVALTRDGAFVCSTVDGIERKAPRGRATRFKLPSGVAAAVRLLPGKRLDELFSVSQSGEVVRLRLQPGLPISGRFVLPSPPFAAVANGEALAFVLVSAPAPGTARRWTLLVTDFAGQERFRVDLASQAAPASEDWLRAVIGDKNLAISELEPLVAVGGASSLTVWDYARGAPVFAR